MKFRLVAIDLDDTLLRDDLSISLENKQAVAEAIRKGVKVVISTGRMYQSALPFARELGINLPLIAYQGALIKDMASGQVILERPVPVELARKVLDFGYQAQVHINLYYDDTLYMDSITKEGTGYANLARVDINAVGDLREFLQSSPTKILFIGDPAYLDRLLEEGKQKFGNHLYITKSKPNYLEFMHPEANKGKALEHLGGVFNILPEEMIAIGDSYNDLDMIKFSGVGVAMGNAPETVKKVADFVTLTNGEHGVAHVINRYLKEKY